MQVEKCLTFLIGPAHSGKSAEACVLAKPGLDTLVIGTANTQHPLMQNRVEALKASRPSTWQHVDRPADVPSLIFAAAALHDQIIVDSLNLWLASLSVNHQANNPAGRTAIELLEVLNPECDRMIDALGRARAAGTNLVVVGAETGASPSPPVETERAFREANGRLNRSVAAMADRVILMTAGIPTVLRDGRVPGAETVNSIQHNQNRRLNP
jgi:adenosylcobinamide kinase/adenosylcobinamide-phosphate guanylyltransferase